MWQSGKMSGTKEALGLIFHTPRKKKKKGGRRWMGTVSDLSSEPF